MRKDDLDLLINREPLPRLRLHATGGMVFDVPENEEPVVTRSTMEFLLPDLEGRQREAVVSLLHIVWVEVVSPPD